MLRPFDPYYWDMSDMNEEQQRQHSKMVLKDLRRKIKGILGNDKELLNEIINELREEKIKKLK